MIQDLQRLGSPLALPGTPSFPTSTLHPPGERSSGRGKASTTARIEESCQQARKVDKGGEIKRTTKSRAAGKKRILVSHTVSIK